MPNENCELQPTDSVHTPPQGSHFSQNKYTRLHYINSANTTYGAIPLPQPPCDKRWSMYNCYPEESNTEDPVYNNEELASTPIDSNIHDEIPKHGINSSILRVKIGQLACSQPLKLCSVIFQLENHKAPPEREKNIASRCMPRYGSKSFEHAVILM